MVSKVALLSKLFLVFAALVLPPSQLGARLARGEDIQPQPSISSASSVDVASVDRFNPNWAGVQCNASTLGEGKFRSITASFAHPSITHDRNSPHIAGVRIAISLGDPYMGNGIIFLFGIQIIVRGERAYYSIVYGWRIDIVVDAFRIGHGRIKTGDIIKITVFHAAGGGLATVENLSQDWGESVNVPWSFDGSTAQWMVQVPMENGRYLRLADFRALLFLDAVASMSSSSGVTTCIPSDGKITDISQGGPLTDTSYYNTAALRIARLRNG